MRDPGYATEALTAAGFTDAAVEERNLDIDLPADTDIPASLLTGVVDQAHRDAVLEAWQSYLAVPPNHIFLELAHQTFSVSRIWTFSPGC